MKKFLYSILTLCLLAISFSNCLKDRCSTTKTFVRFDPIYLTPAEIRKPLSITSARPLKTPGKIYTYKNYLFINELKEGVHIVDNTNPAQPNFLGFIEIHGNVDIAIQGDYLYADQYTDLLTLDIANITQPQLTCRLENVFQLYGYDPYKGYLVEYKPTQITETVGCDDERFERQWWRGGDNTIFIDAADASGSKSNTGVLSSATGVSGSYARMTFYDRYLYAIDNSNLYPLDLATPACPKKMPAVPIGWNIETIFPWRHYLFIGSQTGVFMFDARDPLKPVYANQFTHATGCDPVVCDDKYAFVTVHGGTTCNGNTINQLDIIAIEHMPYISHIKTYPMVKPFGLGLHKDVLFLCDDGFKIFDRTDVTQLKLLYHDKNIAAWDVIALPNALTLVIGSGGLYQFDTSNPKSPRLLSRIPVQ